MIVGVLGGIGAGKSTIVRMLREAAMGSAGDPDQGADGWRDRVQVIDADALAHEALETPRVREELSNWLGAEVFADTGHVDRQALATVVFSDREKLRKLEGLVHPIVRERMTEQIDAVRRRNRECERQTLCILDVPLLASSPLSSECDALLYVDVDQTTRERRVALRRGWSAEELARRERFQPSPEEKRRLADHVIDNSGDEESTRRQVEAYLSRLNADGLNAEDRNVERSDGSGAKQCQERPTKGTPTEEYTQSVESQKSEKSNSSSMN